MVSAGATTLGTFTGSTISDNKDIVKLSKNSKPQLIMLLVVIVGASVLTQSTSTNSSHFLTFVTDNNASYTRINQDRRFYFPIILQQIF